MDITIVTTDDLGWLIFIFCLLLESVVYYTHTSIRCKWAKVYSVLSASYRHYVDHYAVNHSAINCSAVARLKGCHKIGLRVIDSLTEETEAAVVSKEVILFQCLYFTTISIIQISFSSSWPMWLKFFQLDQLKVLKWS